MVSAEKENKVPDISIGVNGNFGFFDVFKRNINFENKKGFYSGGGISAEKLLNDNYGFGSGIQYRHFSTDFVLEDSVSASSDVYTIKWTLQSINIPFLMILSFRGDFFGVNLEAGSCLLPYISILNEDRYDNYPSKVYGQRLQIY